jgi:hypothetical protein
MNRPRERIIRALTLVLAALALPTSAFAHPARIIIARHAEKAGASELCEMGNERAQALAHQYLGDGASDSLFAPGQRPAAMMAMTVHTIETITPAADTWHLPVVRYAITPKEGGKTDAEEIEENQRTQEAAGDVLTDPRYDGKIVVMVWEHKRIASAKLERKIPDQPVTLRQLLHLDKVGAPPTWPGQTYDYFWIIDFHGQSAMPTAFRKVRQVFTPPFDDLPSNHWNKPEPRHLKEGCRD